MIVRSWSGATASERAADYVRHLRRTVIPELESLDGFAGVYLLRRESGESVLFRVLTLWDSLASIEHLGLASE